MLQQESACRSQQQLLLHSAPVLIPVVVALLGIEHEAGHQLA